MNRQKGSVILEASKTEVNGEVGWIGARAEGRSGEYFRSKLELRRAALTPCIEKGGPDDPSVGLRHIGGACAL
jgi:hypothetical protein